YSAPHRTGVADSARVLSVDAQPQVAPRLHGDAKRGKTRPTAEAREHHYAMVRNAMKKGLPSDRLQLVDWELSRGGPFRCCTPVWISAASARLRDQRQRARA